LIEPTVLNGVLKELGLLGSERRSATSLVSSLVEAQIVTGMAESVATDSFAQRVPLELVEPATLNFRMVLCVGSTVRQLVVLVRLLRICIGANLQTCESKDYVEYSTHPTTDTV
jgi:hypothetical protein